MNSRFDKIDPNEFGFEQAFTAGKNVSYDFCRKDHMILVFALLKQNYFNANLWHEKSYKICELQTNIN